MKERATFTLDKDVLLAVDSTIDNFNVKNRSHAVELLLRKALRVGSLKTALVLAGGKEKNNSMQNIAGKPMLEHVIGKLKSYGIINFIISAGELTKNVKKYFEDGNKFDIKITYLNEVEPQGTAGVLRLAKKLLSETFVMCNADELKDINLFDMFNFHRKNNALGTVALTTVKDPSKYGVVKLQGNNIIEFIEKPKENPTSCLINSGLYILEPAVINNVTKEGHSMMEIDILPKLADEGSLYGYSFVGYWHDLEDPESYKKAISLISKNK